MKKRFAPKSTVSGARSPRSARARRLRFAIDPKTIEAFVPAAECDPDIVYKIGDPIKAIVLGVDFSTFELRASTLEVQRDPRPQARRAVHEGSAAADLGPAPVPGGGGVTTGTASADEPRLKPVRHPWLLRGGRGSTRGLVLGGRLLDRWPCWAYSARCGSCCAPSLCRAGAWTSPSRRSSTRRSPRRKDRLKANPQDISALGRAGETGCCCSRRARDSYMDAISTTWRRRATWARSTRASSTAWGSCTKRRACIPFALTEYQRFLRPLSRGQGDPPARAAKL